MPEKIADFRKDALGDFFRPRHARSRSSSQNPLISGNASASTTATIETTARCGDNVIADMTIPNIKP